MIEYTVRCSNVSNQCRANITFNPVLFSVHFWNKKTFLFTSQKRIQLMRKKWISWNAKLSFQWAMKRSWKMRIWWVVSLTSFDWPGEPTQKRAVANCVTDDPFTINHVHLPPSHPQLPPTPYTPIHFLSIKTRLCIFQEIFSSCEESHQFSSLTCESS